MNQSGVDRGMFRSMFYRTYSYAEKVPMGGNKASTSVEKPDRRTTARMRRQSAHRPGFERELEPMVISLALYTYSYMSAPMRCRISVPGGGPLRILPSVRTQADVERRPPGGSGPSTPLSLPLMIGAAHDRAAITQREWPPRRPSCIRSGYRTAR